MEAYQNEYMGGHINGALNTVICKMYMDREQCIMNNEKVMQFVDNQLI